MALKASQIQEQLKNFSENVRQKRLVVEFDACDSCGAPMAFDHERDLVQDTIVERAHCPQCQKKAKARQYRRQ
jgi:hypothetical protein